MSYHPYSPCSPLLCGVSPQVQQLGNFKEENNRDMEREYKRPSPSHAVLTWITLKSQNGQLKQTDARTWQRLWLFR